MADVPFATNLLSAIAPLIANAPGAMLPGQAIGNLPDAYWAGQNQAFRARNQDLFQAGIPRDAAGNIDWNKASQMALAAGGTAAIPEAVSVGNLVGGQAVLDLNRRLNAGVGYSPPLQSGTGPPSSAEATQAEPPTQGTATLRQIAQARGFDVNALASQTKIDPDVPLGYEQRQALAPVLREGTDGQPAQVAEAGANAPATFASRFTGDTGTPATLPPSGAMAGARPVQTVPQTPQAVAQAPAQVAPGARPPALPAQVQQMDAQAREYDRIAREKGLLAAAAGQFGRTSEQKAISDEAERYGKAAQAIRDSILRMTEPTHLEKEANNPAVIAYEEAKARATKQAETNVALEQKQYETITKNYETSQTGLYRLGLIDESIKSLGPQWMGTGANFRANAAKAYNSFRDMLPASVRNETPQFDPKKIGSWEDFNKQTLNLGFETARTLGAREAMQIVNQATKSVPGVEQSFWGARLVSASVRQALQRTADFREFVDTLPPGQRLRADLAFNRLHPPSEYVARAVSVVPPQGAINYLQQHPEFRSQFDAKFGDGASVGVFGAR